MQKPIRLGKILTDQTDQTDQKKNKFNFRSDRSEAQAALEKIPFNINKNFLPTILRHAQRLGTKKFLAFVEQASVARSPERYLMKCLVNSEKWNEEKPDGRSRGCPATAY